MNKSFSVGDLMAMYYENEFSAIEEIALPLFSAKHNRKMKKVFDVFAKNQTSAYNQPVSTTKRPLNIRKRILIAAIIIVSLAFITGSVIAFISNSFRGTVYNDNTYLFAFDIGDSPTVIEEVYTLSIVPEGYELYEVVTSECSISTEYRDSSNHSFVFEQTVKAEFDSHINTEGYELQEAVINGYDAVYVDFTSEIGVSSLVIWNSKDYILVLLGNLAKDELIFLANSNENNFF